MPLSLLKILYFSYLHLYQAEAYRIIICQPNHLPTPEQSTHRVLFKQPIPILVCKKAEENDGDKDQRCDSVPPGVQK
jgi:hypothetical protein